MGLPAARIGDTYALHTDMILTGSPNVLVNGRGFHRVLDIFMCPIVGIGMTMMGSQTVKVNGFFAARVMGVGVCAGQNLIGSGSQDVSVGG